MSFDSPGQRCPRCHVPLPQGVPACPNCGLALGGPPRASRSGPLSPWEPPEREDYNMPPAFGRFGSQSSSGPAMYRPGGPPAPDASGMYRPGGQFAPGAADPWGDDGGTSFSTQRFSGQSSSGPAMYRPGSQPTPDYRQRPDPSGWSGPSSVQRPPANEWERPSGWESPSRPQRPPFSRGNESTGYQDWGLDAPEASGGLYDETAAPTYGGQGWRRVPDQSQPRYAAGAPTAYPGNQQIYQDPFAPYDQGFEPPMPPAPRGGKKVGLIVLFLLVLLGASGGAAYFFLRSRPVITITSKYSVGSTPAGAATTSFHVVGSQFAANSAVSFLLDGQPEPGHRPFQSDADGALSGELIITADWTLGQHSLTAKDASGNSTFQGKTVIIVAQGEANTPGPNGAPADDTPSFIINLVVHSHDPNTNQKGNYTYSLVVTGQPDPAGGTVCNPGEDTGQPQTEKGSSSGVRYTITFTVTCSGSYKGGRVIYMQTFSDSKIVYSNGVTCTAEPFVNQELDGRFSSATAISGTLSSGSATFTCTNRRTVTLAAVDGTWEGSISS